MSTQSTGAGRADLVRLLNRIAGTAESARHATTTRHFVRAVNANHRLDDQANPTACEAWVKAMLATTTLAGPDGVQDTVIVLTDYGREYLGLVALAAAERKAA